MSQFLASMYVCLYVRVNIGLCVCVSASMTVDAYDVSVYGHECKYV